MRNKSEGRRNKQENQRQKKGKKNFEVDPLGEWKEQHIKVCAFLFISPSKVINWETKKHKLKNNPKNY